MANYLNALQFLRSDEKLAIILTTRRHQAIFQRERSRDILLRVKLIAAIFSVLPLIRFAIGLSILPWIFHIPPSLAIEAGLFSVAMAFSALAFLPAWKPTLRNARLAVGLLLLIPVSYFLFTRWLIAYGHISSSSIMLANSDLLLPLIVMAFISVFPLVFLEILVIDIALITVFAFPLLFWFHDIAPKIDNFAVIWFAILIAIISLIASISQLAAIHALFTQASTDPLTGLYNRRAGEALSTLLCAQAERHHHPLSVAFLDLDDFKYVNDQWGHETGDRILRETANVLTCGIRTGDVAVRWGGEEFVVFMPYATMEEAKDRLDTLLTTHAPQKPDGHYMSLSGGIAELWKDHAQRVEDLVDLADRRMYAAKMNGKKQIVITDKK